MLELTLLGPPRVSLDGKPVTGFFSGKVLILFCYLFLEEDRLHDRATLASFLWGERPDSLAKANLRQALHNLLELFPGFLVVTRTTVAIEKKRSYRLDVNVFCQLLEQPKVTPAQLEAALALYTGEFIEGLFVEDAPDLEAWLYTERERYHLLLLMACEQLAAHHIRQGEWERARELAQRVLSLEPWCEASYRQIMLLLARQGEYNAALAQYEACCAVLDDELGAAPAPDTVMLYERIQQARTSKRHNLPLARGVLVGREMELQRLDDWLRDPERRLITLAGPGGVGKTRLAQELAARHTNEFLNGVRFVPLVTTTQPEHIVTAIADVIDARFLGSAAPAEQLIEQLSGQELLLVLDGFEHVIVGTALVNQILQGSEDVKIIVTSREKLDLRQEWLFAVDGLSTPPEKLPAGERLEQYAAIEHFMRCARQHQGDDFVLNGQGTAAAELCRLLGGSPLGIELAAALLPAATCAQIAAEMTHSLDVLSSTRRDLPDRHRSLRAVFEHSWRLLAVHEQAIFPRLSVFRGSFTLEAARQVAGASLCDLNGLKAKSLLRMVVEDDSVARYDTHEILRQYAEEMLASDPAAQQQARIAHFTYYADFMLRQEELLQRKNRQETLVAISGELDNVRLAWQWAIEYRDVSAITQIISPLHKLYEARAWFQEGSDLFARALQALQLGAMPEEQQVIGQLHAHWAAFCLYQGQLREALALSQQAVAILSQYEVGEPLALALNVLGGARCNLGDYEPARRSFQECLDILRALGVRDATILPPLSNLGFVCMSVGDYATARQVLEDGLSVCHQQGIRLALPRFLSRLGYLHRLMNDFTTAQQYYEQAMALSDEMGNLRLKAGILVDLGEIHVRLKAYEQALATCQAGLELARQSAALQEQSQGLFWLGMAYRGLGDHLAACRNIGDGLEISLRTQSIHDTLSFLIGAALLSLDEGERLVSMQLLALVLRHPDAEPDSHAWVQELLAEQGIALAETDIPLEKRSLREVANTTLFELQAKALAHDGDCHLGLVKKISSR